MDVFVGMSQQTGLVYIISLLRQVIYIALLKGNALKLFGSYWTLLSTRTLSAINAANMDFYL